MSKPSPRERISTTSKRSYSLSSNSDNKSFSGSRSLSKSFSTMNFGDTFVQYSPKKLHSSHSAGDSVNMNLPWMENDYSGYDDFLKFDLKKAHKQNRNDRQRKNRTYLSYNALEDMFTNNSQSDNPSHRDSMRTRYSFDTLEVDVPDIKLNVPPLLVSFGSVKDKISKIELKIAEEKKEKTPKAKIRKKKGLLSRFTRKSSS